MKRAWSYSILILLLGASCEEILFEEELEDETVVLVAPTDGAALSLASITFTWQAVEGATLYEVQIATPNFDQPEQFVVNTQVEETSSTQSLTSGTYQWRVRALNENYTTAYSTRDLTVGDDIPFSTNILTLLSPDDTFITNESEINFDWEEVTGALSYRFELIDNETTTVTLSEELEDSDYTINLNEGDFTWQVRAENDTEFTAYSQRSIIIDQTNPNTPSLVAPADDATLTNAEVDFEWDRDDIDGSEERDRIYVYSDVDLQTVVLEEDVIMPFSATLASGTYYWRMRSFDEATNQSDFSDTRSFTID